MRALTRNRHARRRSRVDQHAARASHALGERTRRSRDHASRLVRCRIYDARTDRSRFLEVDPVEGGSCNDYDYVCGDPINATDLDGRMMGYNNMTAAEKRLCKKNRGDCMEVGHMAMTAARMARGYSGGGADATFSNAIQHALWSALISARLGARKAKQWTDAHEAFFGNDARLRRADIHNNAVGIMIGASAAQHLRPVWLQGSSRYARTIDGDAQQLVQHILWASNHMRWYGHGL